MSSIITKYLGPTNKHMGGRVKASGGGTSVVIPFTVENANNFHHVVALVLIAKLDWDGKWVMGNAGGGRGVFVRVPCSDGVGPCILLPDGSEMSTHDFAKGAVPPEVLLRVLKK